MKISQVESFLRALSECGDRKVYVLDYQAINVNDYQVIDEVPVGGRTVQTSSTGLPYVLIEP